MNIFVIAEQVRTVDSAIKYLRDKGLLRTEPPVCATCNNLMSEKKRIGTTDGLVWCCIRRHGEEPRCNSKQSIRKGSFIENSKMEYKSFVMLAYLWAYGISATCQASLCNISLRSVFQWNHHFRDICSRQLVENPIKLGGVGKIVQIEDTLMPIRKQNLDEEKYVFGMYDVETKTGAFVIVKDRSKETIFDALKMYVLPGTMIHSDKTATYVDGQNNESLIVNIDVEPPYQHQWVTQNFVDPNTGVHTNNIKCMWRHAKDRNKSFYKLNMEMFPSYLDEFQWRQVYGRKGEDAYGNLLKQISLFCPVNS